MLKFFRRIREKLFFEGNVPKYVLYGVGEIFFIIIGVLIALAVAEWNNNRNDSQREHSALLSIYRSIESDLSNLKIDSDYLDYDLRRISRLDSLLKGELPSEDMGLDTLFGAVWGMHAFTFDRAYYEDLKATSLNLVDNDSLRQQLIFIYEVLHSAALSLYNREEIMNSEEIRPYYFEHFHDAKFYRTATPNDLEFIWRDNYYKNIVSYRLLTLTENQRKFYSRLSSEMKSLLGMIERHIGIL